MAGRPEAVPAFHLQARPSAELGEQHLDVVEADLPRLTPGTVLVENTHFGVDVHLAAREHSWPLHVPLPAGPAIGRVIASRSAALAVGTLIRHCGGWASHTVVTPGQLGVRILDAELPIPAHAYLGILGFRGLAGYVGAALIARVMPGETVCIVSADGYLGPAAAVTARARGARMVIGGSGPQDEGETGACPSAPLLFDHRVERRGGFEEEVLTLARHGVDAAVVDLSLEHLGALVRMMARGGRIVWKVEPERAAGSARVHDAWPWSTLAQRSVAVAGYDAADYDHLSHRAEELLIPALIEGSIVEPDPVSCSFADLAGFLARSVRAPRPVPIVRIG